ncbi:hypothetical protein EDC56_2054 [Sinobacterium caligoides]|uniref:Uncharacterized protein n=1 Tax=Sinobacterium caligoides TaxID=933926 RepID=A0A3N2DPA0_9GAMM|nr:hypothetical protein EDC56_2054 [Sinobacterium caligoides]
MLLAGPSTKLEGILAVGALAQLSPESCLCIPSEAGVRYCNINLMFSRHGVTGQLAQGLCTLVKTAEGLEGCGE